MLLSLELERDPSAFAPPVAAVYGQLAPIPVSLRGTSVPAVGEATVTGTGVRNNTDMGAVAFVEGAWRGSAGMALAAANRPVFGLNMKRHGVTRGRPPREHLRGLHKLDRTSRGRDSRTGNRGLSFWPRPRRETRTTRKQNANETDCEGN